MNHMKQNEMFPQAQSKAEALMGTLTQLSSGETAPKHVEETISDDFDLDENTRLNIEQTEDVVRDVLQLFGMNYDDLIRMDDTSIYAQAVRENPAVLQYVKASTNPVLEALKIAVNFKPYAEFMNNYGRDPEAIKKAIREEVMAEVNAQAKPKEKQQEMASTPFSNLSGQGVKNTKATEQQTLDQIFGR